MIAPVLHFSRAEFEQRIKITRQEMEVRGLSLLVQPPDGNPPNKLQLPILPVPGFKIQ